jgi:hypothetical protein
MLKIFKQEPEPERQDQPAMDPEKLNQLIDLQIERNRLALSAQYIALGLTLTLVLATILSIYRNR